jgi:tRNA(Ile)-lysidine synthase TilS/MesJ
MARELTKALLAERSINKKFRKSIWNKFIEGVKTYELIEENDNIAVCISGGKDSMMLAVLMKMLQRYSDIPFNLKFIVMDPGYNAENRAKIIENAKLLDIPIHIFETDIFDIADNVSESPCYLCARMRRGHLYNEAKNLGCNKIALGHHMSDVIETTLLSMMYGSQIQGMLPKLHSTNFEGMQLIRPLYCVLEEDIIHWANYNELSFIACACKLTARAAVDENASKRREIKLLIKELKLKNPEIEKNLFNSIHRCNVDTLPGFKKDGEMHSFLEKF